MWQHYFGLGLVKTSENFGVQGEYPSHPALLDWLATEFIRREWDVKAMHKLIVTSATYRQASMVRDDVIRKIDCWPAARAGDCRPTASRRGAVHERPDERSNRRAPVKPYMPPGIWRAFQRLQTRQG